MWMMFNIPIIYTVEVLDGVGDLFTYINSLQALPPELLEEAYFLIDVYTYTMSNQYAMELESNPGLHKERRDQKIRAIINNLDVHHPLKSKSEKIYYKRLYLDGARHIFFDEEALIRII